MLSEKSFDTGQLVINYAEGANNGAPLVLLHGLSSRWQSTWQTFLPSLIPHWHIFALDLRGHGKSGRVGEDYRLSDYAQDVAAFVRATISEPAVLMGHSLGALTAFAAAIKVPEQVRAVVLLDPPLSARNLSINEIPGAKIWFGWVYETMKSNPSYEEILVSCRTFMPDADEASLKGVADQIEGAAPNALWSALQDRLFEGFDLEAGLHRLTCPVLLLRGEWGLGAAMRDEDAEFFVMHCPSTVSNKIPSRGHDLDVDQIEVLPQINRFLASV
jgi:pimeloyl-ACP methyl ester carboxylesterase